MHRSIRHRALAGCASIVVAGCAAQSGVGPNYRISSSSAVATEGASMLQRGRAQLDAGLDASAIESFRAEIRINPNSADAYNGLAVAYGRIGREDLAQRYFETALAKDPSNIKAHSNLAKLNGDVAPVDRLAATAVLPTTVINPSPDEMALGQDPIARMIDKMESPVLAIVEPATLRRSSDQSEEILEREGVLSNQYAAAPVQLAIKAGFVAAPASPDKPPTDLPHPRVPLASLPTDYRSKGTRLERVSLVEVRLITRSELPRRQAQVTPEFDSFGDRLRVWLPQSIAFEQGASIRSATILAAIARAEDDANASSASADLPRFAYLSFPDDTDLMDA